MTLFRFQTLHWVNAFLLLFCSNHLVFANDESINTIDLHPSASGTYTISAKMAPSVKNEFLLDTGATMVMISKKLFKEISQYHTPTSTGKVAASMANGKVKTIPTYTIPSLVLGNGCDVGPIEVAVVRGANRNLIGLNALAKLGALTLDIQQAKLLTSKCPKTLLNEHSLVLN